ncbi:MAG: protein kinase [Deltaproteobacteria bacterium]
MIACARCGAVYAEPVERCGLDGERLGEVAVDPLVGRTIGSYRIERRLGSGAMGCVYLAAHVVNAERFAIKVLRGDHASNRRAAARFSGEARAMIRLRHPNIIRIADCGTTEHGLPYLVMAFVEGRPLDAIIAQGPCETRWVVQVVRQLAEALGAAHAEGFVHRDVKPSNVMVASAADGPRVTLLDFGIARWLVPESPSLTGTGKGVGTPRYMAPEQARGELPTGATDLYALGGVFWEMLSGRALYVGQPAQILAKKLTEPAPPLPEPSAYEDLVYDLLAQDPADRPADARAVIERLDRIDARATTTVEVPLPDTKLLAPVRSAPRRAGRGRWLAAVPVAAFLVGGAILWSARAPEPAPLVAAAGEAPAAVTPRPRGAAIVEPSRGAPGAGPVVAPVVEPSRGAPGVEPSRDAAGVEPSVGALGIAPRGAPRGKSSRGPAREAPVAVPAAIEGAPGIEPSREAPVAVPAAMEGAPGTAPSRKAPVAVPAAIEGARGGEPSQGAPVAVPGASSRRSRRARRPARAGGARRATSPLTKPTEPVAGAKRTLRDALARAHLRASDLKLAPTTASAYARYRSALADADGRAASLEAERIEAALATSALCRITERKLDRLHTRLADRAGRLEPEALRALEDRLLALSSGIGPSPSVKACVALSRALRGLAADLEAGGGGT